MKFFVLTKFYLLFLLISTSCMEAQITSINIGINGLTCSACSYGTERSIRKLTFVKDVKMDLNSKSAEITLTEGSVVDFDALAQKVVDAGFAVRHIKLKIDFPQTTIDEFSKFNAKDFYFIFVGVTKKEIKGEQEILLIDKNYMSAKEFKKWKKKYDMASAQLDSNKFYVATL